MKILHVIGSLDPALGGPPMVATRLAAAQASAGHDVRIIAYDQADRREPVAAALAAIPAIDRVQFIGLSPRRWPQRIFTTHIRRALNQRPGDEDMLHIHGVWDPMYLAATAWARRRAIPYALTPHGMLDPWSLAQRRWKKRLALALGFGAMLDGAAMLHALNDDEARLMQPLALRPPVEVIPNGVFIEELEPLPEPGRFFAEHAELRGRPYVLFLGRLHYKKGLDVLAEAFGQLARQHAGVDLVVAGPDEGAQADFQRRIGSAGLTERVHLTGPLYGPTKIAAMVDAVCFCLPSRQEGFSLAITEAMACGRPVVITQACHFPQVAQCGAGQVVALDAAAVAAALATYCTDEAAAAAAGRAGRDLVHTHYTWPSIAQRMIEAYQRHIR